MSGECGKFMASAMTTPIFVHKGVKIYLVAESSAILSRWFATEPGATRKSPSAFSVTLLTGGDTVLDELAAQDWRRAQEDERYAAAVKDAYLTECCLVIAAAINAGVDLASAK
jgi:hypothetical protein